MNEGKNNSNGKKKIGISEFVEKNHKLLTVFGVFLALTSYLTVTNQTSVAISFILSVLVGLSILGKSLNIKNTSVGLTFFALFLFLLLFSIATFVSVTFEGIVAPIIIFLIMGGGAYITIKSYDWVDSRKWKNNNGKRILFIVIGIAILFVSTSLYGVKLDQFNRASLNDYKLNSEFMTPAFVGGSLFIIGFIVILNLYHLIKSIGPKLFFRIFRFFYAIKFASA